MKLRVFSVFSIMLVVLLFCSCSKNSDSKGIELEMNLLPETITDCLYSKMNYKFTLTDQFSGLKGDDYLVFVHFWRLKTKEMLLQDDHKPEKPVTQWKAGDSISYSRVAFIPQFLDEFDIDFEGYEEVKLTIGLFQPKVEGSKIVLFEKVLTVESASEKAPEKVYDEGWHQPETDPKIQNPNEKTWRWTGKRAVCIVENPRKEALLIVRGGVDKAILADQKVIIKIDDVVLDEFIPETAKFDKTYVISPEKLGTEDEFKLIFETDKTFIPSALNKDVNDSRELGIQVFFLYFRENIK
jgi:hypothetical protein